MERCIIIGAGELEEEFLSGFSWRTDDFIICADGGLRHAQRAGIRPDLLIGDQDSFAEGFPQGMPALICQPEKDDSDMMLAVKEGISRGYKEFILLGATGGRFDHTLANLQTIAYGLEQDVFITIADQYNLISMLREDTVFLPKMDGCYLSVFSYTPNCEGVTLTGVKYPLKDAKLTNWFPLGLSNEILAQNAQITVEKGILVIVISKDRPR